MSAFFPGGLSPVDKSALPEAKYQIYHKNYVDPPPRSDLLPEADRVQFSNESQTLESSYPSTDNPDIKKYIEMLKKEKDF
jgi:hypothetical protein